MALKNVPKIEGLDWKLEKGMLVSGTDYEKTDKAGEDETHTHRPPLTRKVAELIAEQINQDIEGAGARAVASRDGRGMSVQLSDSVRDQFMEQYPEVTIQNVARSSARRA